MGTRIVTKFAPGYSEHDAPLQECKGGNERVVLHLTDGEIITNAEHPSNVGKYAIRASLVNVQEAQGPSESDPAKIVSGVRLQIQYEEEAVTRPLTSCNICELSCITCSVRDYLEKDNSGSPYVGGQSQGKGIEQKRYCFNLSNSCIDFPVEVLSLSNCVGKLYSKEEDGEITGKSRELLADALNCHPVTGALGWWQWLPGTKTLCVYSFGEKIDSLSLKTASGKILCLEPEETQFNDPLAAYQQASFDYTKKNIIRALGTADCFANDGDDVSDGGDDSGDCAYDEEFSEEFMRRLSLHLKCGSGQPDGEAGVGHRVWEIDEETDINSVTTHPDGSPLMQGDIVYANKGTPCEVYYRRGATEWYGPHRTNFEPIMISPVTLFEGTFPVIGNGNKYSFTGNLSDYADKPCVFNRPIFLTEADDTQIVVFHRTIVSSSNDIGSIGLLDGAVNSRHDLGYSMSTQDEFRITYDTRENGDPSFVGRAKLVGWW